MFAKNQGIIDKFDFFMKKAHEQALLSNKENTKVGALLIDENGLILLSECNNYLEPVYSHPSLLNKETRKLYSEHAERRIIYTALKKGISKMGDKTLVVTHFPCCECARSIILTGIRKIVVDSIDFNSSFYIKWIENIKISYGMLISNNVLILLKNGQPFREEIFSV